MLLAMTSMPGQKDAASRVPKAQANHKGNPCRTQHIAPEPQLRRVKTEEPVGRSKGQTWEMIQKGLAAPEAGKLINESVMGRSK